MGSHGRLLQGLTQKSKKKKKKHLKESMKSWIHASCISYLEISMAVRLLELEGIWKVFLSRSLQIIFSSRLFFCPNTSWTWSVGLPGVSCHKWKHPYRTSRNINGGKVVKYKEHSSNNEWTQCWKHSGNGGDYGKLDNQMEQLLFPPSILSSWPDEDSFIHSFN